MAVTIRVEFAFSQPTALDPAEMVERLQASSTGLAQGALDVLRRGLRA